MAIKWECEKTATPTRSNKRTKKTNAGKRKRLSPDSEGSDGQVELALACKPLKVAIPEDKKKFNRLKANLEKMGCAGLLDVTWHHKEPAWLQEIWKRDRSAFPNTVRADPGLWREELLGEIFGLNRDGVSLQGEGA
jgi:hypothetical protein